MTQAHTIASYIVSLNEAFDARADFERSKAKDDSSNIHKTLAKLRKNVTRESVASFFMSHNIDAALINRAIRADSRINVYAYEKIENVASAALKSEALNHYSVAILKSALSLEGVDSALTFEDAKAACSADSKLKDNKRDKLIKRYSRIVASGTASTQSSSSLEALCAFDVLKRSRNSEGDTVFIVNHENDVAKALIERVA